jgi:hypothetical protein
MGFCIAHDYNTHLMSYVESCFQNIKATILINLFIYNTNPNLKQNVQMIMTFKQKRIQFLLS